jgi:bifunctional DNA-binding transcriptional regulator/antitoxin component of YhaV-PrlF toxin-antitoxin module
MKTNTLQVKDNNGELYFEIPDELMERMGWSEGDDLQFEETGEGSFTIKKVKMADVEMEFSEEELFKYMKLAHEQGCSLNEWINHVLKSVLIDDHLDNLYKQD